MLRWCEHSPERDQRGPDASLANHACPNTKKQVTSLRLLYTVYIVTCAVPSAHFFPSHIFASRSDISQQKWRPLPNGNPSTPLLLRQKNLAQSPASLHPLQLLRPHRLRLQLRAMAFPSLLPLKTSIKINGSPPSLPSSGNCWPSKLRLCMKAGLQS